MFTIFHASSFRPGGFHTCLGARLVLFFLGACLPLRADPTPSLDQLYVVDQGSQLSLIWHFYPKLLPARLVLPGSAKSVDLWQPATLKQNLHDLVLAAFTLQLDGKDIVPTKLDELTVAPDGGCFTTVLYPGHRGARIGIQDNLLPLYPAGYVMNYEIYNPRHRALGISGYFSGGAASPVIHYMQQNAATAASASAWFDSQPVSLFKTELRTPWIDTNWLLLSLTFLLTRPLRQALVLSLELAAVWMAVIALWCMADLQLPWDMPALVAGIVTALVCLLGSWTKTSWRWIVIGALLAALVNACLDVRQIPFERPVPSPENLAGIALGFLLSLGVIVGVGTGLIAECRRYPEFQRGWAPKICWALAAAAIVLSL